MSQIYHPLLALIASATNNELAKYVEYLKEENKILRARIPGGVGGGIAPPPTPQTGLASFQASGFPDVSQRPSAVFSRWQSRHRIWTFVGELAC